MIFLNSLNILLAKKYQDKIVHTEKPNPITSLSHPTNNILK